MSTLAGAIEIQMLADLARLKKDMDAAKGMVGDAAREMQRYADLAKAALGGIAAGLTIGAFKGMVQDSIDAAEALHDLAIQTGATVEGLSALQAIGRTTGTSAEAIGGAMNKLGKTLAVANEESKGAAQAIKALGLDFNAFKQLQAKMSPHTSPQHLGRPQGCRAFERNHLTKAERRRTAQYRADVTRVLHPVKDEAGHCWLQLRLGW